MESLRANLSIVELTELLHIGLVSSIHLRRVLDFILEILQEKTLENNFHSVSKICDALIECPCSVDLILQLYTPSHLLTPLENFCNHWTPESTSIDFDMDEGEQKTAPEQELDGVQLLYNKFGKVWHLIFSVMNRFKVNKFRPYIAHMYNILLFSFTRIWTVYLKNRTDLLFNSLSEAQSFMVRILKIPIWINL